MSIFNRIFKRPQSRSFDSIAFDTKRYRYQGEQDDHRVWFTPDGDGIGLYFFPKQPDLPVGASSAAEVQESYRAKLPDGNAKIIEFQLPSIDEVKCIWMILKILRKPHGATYLGSLTIPFAEFSFVIKMQCEERGITGIREAALLILAQKEGTVTISADGKLAGDWNPDDERYDTKFPEHPLSRLRREFAQIKSTLQINQATKDRRRFALPN
jgi:hypothetical protein